MLGYRVALLWTGRSNMLGYSSTFYDLDAVVRWAIDSLFYDNAVARWAKCFPFLWSGCSNTLGYRFRLLTIWTQWQVGLQSRLPIIWTQWHVGQQCCLLVIWMQWHIGQSMLSYQSNIESHDYALHYGEMVFSEW